MGGVEKQKSTHRSSRCACSGNASGRVRVILLLHQVVANASGIVLSKQHRIWNANTYALTDC